jgi:hypothetical protein
MRPPPAHLLASSRQQDPPHLAALHPDAGVPGRLGKGVQGPLAWPGLDVLACKIGEEQSWVILSQS